MSATPETDSAPQITVLMPVKTYHPKYLAEAVESIKEQTSPAWELKIIIEKSEQAHFSAVLQQSLLDPRITLVVNRGRKLAGAFNSGMAEAKTEFVAILLADDRWAPHAVKSLGDAIHTYPNADFFHSSRRYIDEDSAPISTVYRCRENVILDDFREQTPVKHLLCWRLSLARKAGGMDESLNSVGPDDFDFPWTMAEHGATFQAISHCLYEYREHDKCFRLTTGLPLSVHEAEIRKVLTKHGLAADAIEAWIEQGRNTYLQQCKYRSKWHRWWVRLTGKRGRFTAPTYS